MNLFRFGWFSDQPQQNHRETMRKTLSLFIILLLPALALGQGVWEEEGGFPDDTTFTGNMHGVAVDAEGKVWLTPFFATAWIDPATGDSVRDANGNAVSTIEIHVYNADGTQAFDPIRTITVDGVQDTLFSSARGLRADHNGNILHVDGSGNMWRIDHTTGEGMNKAQPGLNGWTSASMAQPGVTDDGTIFVAAVIQGNPIQIYSEDFEFVGTAVDTARGFSRGFEVSGDGNTIYWGGFTNGQLHVYNRADEFSPFGEPDTLWRGIWAESFTRDPDGNVWISNDSRADSGTVWANPENYLRWRIFDPEFGKFSNDEESFQFTLEYPSDPVTEFARGMAFAPDGMTAYAVLWDVNTSGQVAPERQVAVKKFVKKDATAIERVGEGIPTAFSLEQNYPNPFNPSTTIQFSLTEPGPATLRVYDSYGRLVRTLVDGHMVAGSYSAPFNASDLASGNYFYHLEVNGQRLSGKMTLLK